MDSSVAPIVADQDQAARDASAPPKIGNKGGWTAAIFIVFVEMAERFAYYGLAGNLITFLTNNLEEPLAVAAKNMNTWVGVSSIFPLFGAFLADSYLGRFRTIILSSLIYLSGMILLTLSVSVVPADSRKMVFYVALYILAIGEGGHKPCVQTFAADQFGEDNPEEKAAKSSFFNWWYLGIVIGATAASLLVTYVQDNVGWTTGLGILVGVLAAALLVFLIGVRRYRAQAPIGSPFTRIAQVVVAAARKQGVTITNEACNICYQECDILNGGDPKPGGQLLVKGRRLAPTHQFRFLDKAMIMDKVTDSTSKTRNPWRTCTLNQVEEVKLIIRLVPIWLSCLMFSAITVQSHTFFIKQGSTMVRSIGSSFQFPPAWLQAFTGLAILATVPLYDQVFVPSARYFSGHTSGITMLQRIGIGLFLSILEMVVAALVEAKRVGVARDHGMMDTPKAIVPMTIWWLLPQYIISGFSDVFSIVGLQELFYDQVPESMRSMGAAAYISVTGVGSFINSTVILVVQAITSRLGGAWLGNNINRARLHYFYAVLAVLSALNLCVYVWIARGFLYKKLDQEEGEDKETK